MAKDDLKSPEEEMKDEEYAELVKLYNDIYDDGFWVKEIVTATVGDLRDLDVLVEESDCKDRKEVHEALGLGEMIDLGAGPGEGKTRAEKIQDAWDKAKKAREDGYFPRLNIAREKLGLPIEGETKQMGTF